VWAPFGGVRSRLINAKLTISRGRTAATIHQLGDDGRVVIGASQSAGVRLADDPQVAPLHAEIRIEDGRWVLIRCTVRNNLKLNGHKVESPLPLRSGDRITAGETTLLFEANGESARSSLEGSDEADSESECWLPSGSSKVIRDFMETLRRFAASDESVLLSGETGSGKEVAARAIHEFSPRRNSPFVVVNCPALPSTLVESELFGIERGVATGVDAREGLLEMAHHGSIFLDEVGDLEPLAQAKLLRFLQERKVRSIGGRQNVRLDVRVIAATHHDLDADVAAGRFRQDLHYRLKVLTLRVPSLRERPEDIPALVDEFRRKFRDEAPRYSAEVLDVFRTYPWPGNVREMLHLVRSLDVLVEGDEVRLEHLPEGLRCNGTSRHGKLYQRVVIEKGCFWELVQRPFLNHELSRDEVRCFIAKSFEEAGNSYLGLARLLRIESEYKRLLDFLGRHKLGVKHSQPVRVAIRPPLRSVSLPGSRRESRDPKKSRPPESSILG
jgi:DNA-binding NtrC family response regulator